MSKNPKGKASEFESPEELARQREQEVIVVPKGQSRFKTLVIWACMIFVLFIFSVGGAFQDTLSGGGSTGAVHLSWKGVDGEPRSHDVPEFYAKKQEYGRLRELYPFLGMQEMDPNKDSNVARMIVMSDLALGAGVRITDADLADAILRIFGSADAYSSTLADPISGYAIGWIHRQRGLNTKSFEKTLRDVLVIQRFSRLLALGAASVNHDELVTRWQATRTEYSFDYVEARTSDFEPEVQNELPEAAALETWFMARPATEQRKLHSPERWGADFAILTLPVAAGAGEQLLAAYPRPEDEVSAFKARDYYNSFIGTRFRRPEEVPAEDVSEEDAAGDDAAGDDAAGDDAAADDAAGDDAAGDDVAADDSAETTEGGAQETAEGAAEVAVATDGAEDGTQEEDDTPQPQPQMPFLSYEEVEALCLVEAPLYYSLADWHIDVQQRISKDESVELAAECERLGLTLVSDGSMRSLEEWNEVNEEWSGKNIGNGLRFTQAGRYAASLNVHPGAILAAQVTERIAPALPEFPEIEVEVAAAWIKDAAVTRADYTLKGILDRVGQKTPGEPFEPMTTPEQFATASSNAGGHAQKDFDVQHRAFQERFVLPKPGEEPSAFEGFLRFNPQLFDLKEGRVWEPKPTRDRESLFLVLVGPSRPADVGKMKPQDLAVQRSQMASDSIRSFFNSTFDFESEESLQFLAANFDYFLQGEEEEEEDPAGGAAGG